MGRESPSTKTAINHLVSPTARISVSHGMEELSSNEGRRSSRMRKRGAGGSQVDKAVVEVWQREVGLLSTRQFAHRLASSQDLVFRFDIYRKLEKHRGCVNTVSFNGDGDILVSGSDDRRVILWDWETGNAKLSFHSGHVNNVFQAKFMPFSDDRSIVTCAADGQVRHAQILECGRVETSLLAKHNGRAHKLAIEPGSSHIFYTCGEDGQVLHFDLRTRAATELFTCEPLTDRRCFRSAANLNAITIDPRNPSLFAIAGYDEYTRLYDMRKYRWDASTDFGQPADYFCPPHLIGDWEVGITGLSFSDHSELLVSYIDEFIYLFTRDMGLGPNQIPSSPHSMRSDASETGPDSLASSSNMDIDKKAAPQVYKGHQNHKTVKGVGFFGPGCEYVVSGSDCGRIFIWKKNGGDLIRVMEADNLVVNCIKPHPHTPVLASSGMDSDIKIWTPMATERAVLPTNIQQVFRPQGNPWLGIDGDDDEDYFDDDADIDGDEDEDDEDELDVEDGFYDGDDNDNDDDDSDDSDDNDDGDDGSCSGSDNIIDDVDRFLGSFDDDANDSDSRLLCSAETKS